MKKIIILYDYSNDKCVSHVEVKELIELEQEIIYTNCLPFFDTTSLQKGYDVEIQKKDKSYIRLSEVMKKKAIRETMNIHKIFMSGALEFKEMV